VHASTLNSLLCYRPLLSQANINEITEAIMTQVAAEQKKKKSKSKQQS